MLSLSAWSMNSLVEGNELAMSRWAVLDQENDLMLATGSSAHTDPKTALAAHQRRVVKYTMDKMVRSISFHLGPAAGMIEETEHEG
jgi:hypothetical protein